MRRLGAPVYPMRLIRLFKFASAGVLLGGLAAAAWLAYFALTPIDVPAEARELTVKPGRSARAVGRDLVAAGVLEEPWSFVTMARLLRQDNAMKAGNYELPARITPYRLLEMVARGEVSQAQITFIEGWTFAQMRAALAQHPSVAHDTAALTDAQVLRAIGASETHPEGLFFPDTYYFSPGTRELKILARAYHTMRTRLDALWAVRAPGLPYASPYEALIMASIVEKETGLDADRRMIAAVFVNRLKRGMRLQTDPTVIYGLGAGFDGNLRRIDLETDSPYNTYTRTGLPPTPIALPGPIRARSGIAAGTEPGPVFRGAGRWLVAFFRQPR